MSKHMKFKAYSAPTHTIWAEREGTQSEEVGRDVWDGLRWVYTVTGLPGHCWESGVVITIPKYYETEMDLPVQFSLLARPEVLLKIGEAIVNHAKGSLAWEKLNDELGPTVAAIEKELTTKEESNGKQQAKDTVPN